MNLNLEAFKPIPKVTNHGASEIEKGRAKASIRPVKNRPGFICIYISVEKSVVNQNVKYEPCVASGCNNLIVLKPQDTGCRFSGSVKNPRLLCVSFDRNKAFLPELIAQEYERLNGRKLFLKVKHEGDIYVLYIDNQMALFND